MTTNRTTEIGGIWAEGAPDIPESTIPGTLVTYAKSNILESEIIAGWPYKKIVDSATLNEVMKRVTTLLSLLESYGIIPWCATTQYVTGAQVMGSDDKIYTALDSNINYDPVSYPAHWLCYVDEIEGKGDDHVYVVNSGYQQLTSPLIINWGRGTSSGTTPDNAYVTFEKEFPTACMAVVANILGPGGENINNVQVGTFTKTGCYFSVGNEGVQVSGLGIGYIAIGY